MSTVNANVDVVLADSATPIVLNALQAVQEPIFAAGSTLLV